MLNKVQLIGRLGSDPDAKTTPSGDVVASFNLATTERWKDKEGNKKESTEWHRVVVWRRLAEVCRDYLAKGSLVYIEGKLVTRKWQDKDGADRYTTEIQASEMKMLGGNKSGEEQRDINRPATQQPMFRSIVGDDVPF